MKEFDSDKIYMPNDKMLINGEVCIAVESDGDCDACVLKPNFYIDSSCKALCSSFLGQRSDRLEIHFEKLNEVAK